MVTPTTGRNGDVATDGLAALTRRLVDAGVHGLFPCGSTGEFTSLTRDQRRTVVETVVEAADGTPVLAGCGGTSVRDVRSHVADAARAGADAAVVVAPYYLPSTQDSLREFFETVADDADLPVVLYEIPGLAGESLAVETVADLAGHDGVVGIKDSTGDLGRVDKLRQAVPDEFAVLQGSTVYGVASLDLGADGVVPGEGNVVPGALVDAYEAHADGDRDRAVDVMNDRVYPISREITEVATIPAVKYLAGRAGGFAAGPPLPPLPELTADEKRRVAETL